MSTAAASSRTAIDFSRSSVSRYVQLATLFRRRIESGQWPVGHQMPTVDELAQECRVARATVRQALGLLEDEQLIERFRAKGTFVTARPQDQAWCEVASDWSGQLLAPEGATIEVLSARRKAMPAEIVHPIGAPAPSYRHWRRRHWRNGRPYYLGDVYVDERLCRRIPPESFRQKTSMRILRELPGLAIAQAQQTLTLGMADPVIADLLQLPLNAPIANVYRTAVDSRGCRVFVAAGVYRGDVVRLDIRLK